MLICLEYACNDYEDIIENPNVVYYRILQPIGGTDGTSPGPKSNQLCGHKSHNCISPFWTSTILDAGIFLHVKSVYGNSFE